MGITYKYVPVRRPDGTLLHAPYIPIKVHSAVLDRWLYVNFLVDSGADTTVIPKELALSLGMTEDAETINTSGIG